MKVDYPSHTTGKNQPSVQDSKNMWEAESYLVERPVRILRLREVIRKTGIARSTIYDWLNHKSTRYDPDFPKPVVLGKQSVGWLESELDEWIFRKVGMSRKQND